MQDNIIRLIDIFDTVLVIFNIGDAPYAFSKTVTKAIRDVNNSRMLSLPFITFIEKSGEIADEFTDSEDIDYSNSYITTNALTGNVDDPEERLYDCMDFFEGPFINYVAYLSAIKLVEFDEQLEMKAQASKEIDTYMNNNDLFKNSYKRNDMISVAPLKLPKYASKLSTYSGGTYYVEEE